MPDPARQAVSRGPKCRMDADILGAASREIHEIRTQVLNFRRICRVYCGMYSTKRGLGQAENRTREGATECVAGVETVACEVDDTGPRHRIDVALDCCLRLAARGASRKAACPGHCRVDRRQRSDRIQMHGIAHMNSGKPQRVLSD